MEKFLMVAGAAFFGMVLSLVMAIPAGAVLMLLMERLHHYISPAIPALGFEASYVLSLLLSSFLYFLLPKATTSD